MALFIRPQIPTLIRSSHADLKSCTPNLSMTAQNRNPENILGGRVYIFRCQVYRVVYHKLLGGGGSGVGVRLKVGGTF